MKDAPAFDFYPERFWFAVEGWPDHDILRYFRLLSQAWMRDGLPSDLRELTGLARGKVSERVLAKFPVAEDGRRRNPFMETLRREQRQRIEKRRLGAQKTNAQRWGSESNRDRSAIAQRVANDVGSDTSSDSPTSRHHPPPTTHHPPLVLLEKEPKDAALPAGSGKEAGKPSRNASLDQARTLAVEANNEPIPRSLQPMAGYLPFEAAWGEWCDYRTERATAALVRDRLPWTRRAARNALLEIERVAAGVGLERITNRIREAMAGSWQGLNLDRMTTTPSAAQRPPQPSFHLKSQHESI